MDGLLEDERRKDKETDRWTSSRGELLVYDASDGQTGAVYERLRHGRLAASENAGNGSQNEWQEKNRSSEKAKEHL